MSVELLVAAKADLLAALLDAMRAAWKAELTGVMRAASMVASSAGLKVDLMGVKMVVSRAESSVVSSEV